MGGCSSCSSYSSSILTLDQSLYSQQEEECVSQKNLQDSKTNLQVLGSKMLRRVEVSANPFRVFCLRYI